jgi:1-acyl-sn-glycerol-3-phosphate acyltransferase
MNRLFAGILRIVCVWTWPEAYRNYIARITTSGHISKPSTVVRFLCQCLFRVLSFIWVGRIRRVGLENLNAPGRLIFSPNHSSLLDAVVMYATVRRPVRAMGARETMLKGAGLAGIVLTKLGAFPVDRSNGKTVIAPATELMVRGECLAMFPEGRISPTGEMLPFKHGIGVISAAVYEQLGGKELVGIVPIRICFHKRDNASALNFAKMGLKWRGGVTVTFCKPIYLNDLTNHEPGHIVALVRSAIEGVGCSTLPL